MLVQAAYPGHITYMGRYCQTGLNAFNRSGKRTKSRVE